MKRRASGEITEDEAALSNPRETGHAGWKNRQASASEEEKIPSITEDLLGDLYHSPLSSGQDGVHFNSGVIYAGFYPNASFYLTVDSPQFVPLSCMGHENLRINGASVQGQELGFENYTALQTWDGSQLVSNRHHTLLAADISQASAAVHAAAPTPAAGSPFYGPHVTQQNFQGYHPRYDFGDDPVNYLLGPVFPRQSEVHQYGNHRFQPGLSFTDFLNSDEPILVAEATPAPKAIPTATSVPQATPPPKAIPTANPPKKQKRKKKEEKRSFLRRQVHKEDIPIRKFRFGPPPPDDPTRRTQRHGKRGVETAAAGEE
ncbi:uncharacterized protein H6S33_008711 [Morchella sextelata]|uniref:uncharacterized protein n=1 Tax=Morchella sextelata TaxID=1174677 RepID=UPI001D050F4E|nr:uncharacterized protein H6S33_008711 [Morchella sextelata]KAH0602372.1 hypothetical protein H6S33_008711 [Morchella sextelata]